MNILDMRYYQIPTAEVFKQDTSIKFAVRSSDPILKHIDWLLERFHDHLRANRYAKYMVILADLFHTCNYWLKSYYENNPAMKKERYVPVRALFDVVVEKLQEEFGCELRAEVSRVLDETFGRDLHPHGLHIDGKAKQARYFSRKERQIYRLRFKGGRAYQHPWWRNPPSMELVLADSSRAYTAMKRMGASMSERYGGFIMTMQRELFMAKHWVGSDNSQAGVFHSSYTAGDRVIMAGSMLIKGGVIRAVRADSGHYRPDDMNMVALLQGLGMFGVALRRVDLYNHEGVWLGVATDFLKEGVSWERFEAQRLREQAHRAEGDDYREQALHQKRRFPHLRPQGGPQGPGQANANAPAQPLSTTYVQTIKNTYLQP